jgi:hypothetical protein
VVGPPPPRQRPGQQGQQEVRRGDQQQVAGASGVVAQRDQGQGAGQGEERSGLPGRGARPGSEQAQNFRSSDVSRLIG